MIPTRRRKEEKKKKKEERAKRVEETRITKMTIPGYCGWRGEAVKMVFMVFGGNAAVESEREREGERGRERESLTVSIGNINR